MLNRVSRASFAHHKSKDVALSKAADLTPDHTEVGVASRTAPFIISTESVDRDGDTLALDGWDLKDYQKNPIVLFDHNPSQPIGKSTSIFVQDDALRAVAWFPDKDTSELGDWVFKMIQADILRTASVTFLPLEFTQAADRASSSPWGAPPMNFIKQKLLEWSVVSVPSNQDALHQAKGLKIDWKPYKAWIEKSLDEAKEFPWHLAAPVGEYEKTYAVVKSFLPSKPKSVLAATPAASPKENSMHVVSKAGKVLNQENQNRLKAAMKHADDADKFQQKAMDLHEKADTCHQKAMLHSSKCAEHMKAVMESADAKPDEGGDEGQESDENDSKKIDDGNEESKAADDSGKEDEVVDEGSGGEGTVTPTVKPNLPGSEDYYSIYAAGGNNPKAVSGNTKEAEILASARKAIKGEPAKPKTILDEDFSEEEVASAMKIATDRIKQKHLRKLRGQD
jgi:hypothetical protein